MPLPRAPVVAFALLLVLPAVVAGALFVAVGSGSVGAAWALVAFLAVVVALTAFTVLRRNGGRAGEP